MRIRNVVAALLVTGAVAARPAEAQRVVADVIVRAGPILGHVMVDDGYSSYSGDRVVVYREAPRVIVVHRFRHRHHWKHWRRHGYRPVTLYYADGHYYERHRRGVRGERKVVVYERGGRYYRGWDDDRRGRHRDRDRDHDRWDD